MIGLNVVEAYTLKAADRQAVFASAKALGVDEVRCEFPWSIQSAADAMMSDARRAGLGVLGMVTHPPKPRPGAVDFGYLMGGLAKRYPDVKAWEIWNEPNLELYWPGKDKAQRAAKPEEYVSYLQAAHATIKANSDALVVFGGLAAASTKVEGVAFQLWPPKVAKFTNYDPVKFLERALKAGAKGHFDVLALHPYSMDAGFRWLPFSPANPYVAAVDIARMVLDDAKLTSVPIWATEYGFPTTKFSPTGAGLNLERATRWLELKVARQYIYSYRDNVGGGDYGLVAKNNVARPAAGWLKGYLGA